MISISISIIIAASSFLYTPFSLFSAQVPSSLNEQDAKEASQAFKAFFEENPHLMQMSPIIPFQEITFPSKEYDGKKENSSIICRQEKPRPIFHNI